MRIEDREDGIWDKILSSLFVGVLMDRFIESRRGGETITWYFAGAAGINLKKKEGSLPVVKREDLLHTFLFY